MTEAERVQLFAVIKRRRAIYARNRGKHDAFAPDSLNAWDKLNFALECFDYLLDDVERAFPEPPK